jgi:Ni/Co efflux regulator RcnB
MAPAPGCVSALQRYDDQREERVVLLTIERLGRDLDEVEYAQFIEVRRHRRGDRESNAQRYHAYHVDSLRRYELEPHRFYRDRTRNFDWIARWVSEELQACAHAMFSA